MILNRRQPLPNGQPFIEVIAGLEGVPGPIDIRLSFVILRKDADHGISGYLPDIRRNQGMPPVQEMVEGQGAEGGDGGSGKFPQFPMGRSPDEWPLA